MRNLTQEDLQAAADHLDAAINAEVASDFCRFYLIQDAQKNWHPSPTLVCAMRANPSIAAIVETKPTSQLSELLNAEQREQLEDIQAGLKSQYTRETHRSYLSALEEVPSVILDWLRLKIAEIGAINEAIQVEREACTQAVAQFEGSEKMVAAIRARILVAQDFVGKWFQLADGAWECTEVNYLGDLTLRRHGLNYEDEKVTQRTSISLFQLCLPSEHHLFVRMIK